jgi:hypothetical protein
MSHPAGYDVKTMPGGLLNFYDRDRTHFRPQAAAGGVM